MNVLIVDDHKIFREGFERVLGSIDFVAKIYHAANGEDALLKIKENSPDLVFMDVHMKVLDGTTATKLAIKKFPNLKIIALSQFEDDNHVIKMYNAGASGYLSKYTDFREINNAINIVKEGKKYFAPHIIEKVITYSQKKQAFIDENILSYREIQILLLICKGKSDKEIANLLFVSARTIEWHRINILSKTNNKSIAMLINYAIDNGLYFP